jgi:hypothetical protein
MRNKNVKIILFLILIIIFMIILFSNHKLINNTQSDNKKNLDLTLAQGDINGTPPQYYNRCLFILQAGTNIRINTWEYYIELDINNEKCFSYDFYDDLNSSYIFIQSWETGEYWNTPEIIGYDLPENWWINNNDKVTIRIINHYSKKIIFEDYFIFEALP